MRIRFYRTGRGDAPVEEYIDELPERERARVIKALADIRQRGLRGSAVPLRQIRNKLWEIKVQPHRIFYAVLTQRSLVLLHAYRKQGQKAPRVEIETALMHLAKHREQENDDEEDDEEETGKSSPR
jgi:phage-related protein